MAGSGPGHDVLGKTLNHSRGQRSDEGKRQKECGIACDIDVLECCGDTRAGFRITITTHHVTLQTQLLR